MNEPNSVQDVEKIEQIVHEGTEEMARMFMALTEEELQSIKQSSIGV